MPVNIPTTLFADLPMGGVLLLRDDTAFAHAGELAVITDAHPGLHEVLYVVECEAGHRAVFPSDVVQASFLLVHRSGEAMVYPGALADPKAIASAFWWADFQLGRHLSPLRLQ